MKLTLSFSPCPNDCFIFDAMIHGRINTEGLEFDARLEDVETLNREAFEQKTDITKLSFHAYAHCTGDYVLLNAGSALGRNCGPLLISKRKISAADVAGGKLLIAVPGKYTTANFLLDLAFPAAKNKKEMLFSDIEKAVLSGDADAGLIIHESRFTFELKGLKKILDLGEYWETLSGLPLPLGGIAIKRSLLPEIKQKVNRVLRRSVEYAFTNPSASKPFVRVFAQEMSEVVIQQHIALYVNEFSFDLGDEGRKAINTLFLKAKTAGIIPAAEMDLFCDDLK
ncbi:MAG TPA: 1,4-dihydroxy-6-naphthoate synthase [Bacteroidia bacterium]|nr:1,4-dihydroxy-6-naphthoate synthase [Bacteroidia bacterium]